MNTVPSGAVPPMSASRARSALVASLDRKAIETGLQTVLSDIRSGRLSGSYEPMLPALLNLKGNPYTLKNHFPFAPFFSVYQPATLTCKSARQVSKSVTLAATGVIHCAAVPYFSTLFITPLFDQIRRFSSTYVKRFIDNSPIKHLMIDSKVDQSVQQRTFTNDSSMGFTFAFLDAERIRGYMSDHIKIDEFQDFNLDFVPIIAETMSASEYRFATFSGTPKTIDGPLETVWQQSSMAEWFIPCRAGGCNAWNIPSVDHHLLDMLGPLRDDISDSNPGLVCHKCRKPINPRHGGWVHRHPERVGLHTGLHVPQPIMPMHYAKKDRWAELLAKQQGANNTAPHVFFNEVLGESYDSGSKLVSQSELEAACTLPWKNRTGEPDDRIMTAASRYERLVLGVDWGGGGVQGISFTALALVGMQGDGRIDVLWGKRLLTPNDHPREAMETLSWFKKFRAQLIVHDFTGSGSLRGTLIVQSGVPKERIVSMRYSAVTSGPMVKYMPADELQSFDLYRIDKARSLQTTLNAVRFGFMRFFAYDRVDNPPGLLHDFLALVEEKTESRHVGDIYTIRRAPGQTDDFAHAVNLATMACWQSSDKWPDFARAISANSITAEQEAKLSGNWQG